MEQQGGLMGMMLPLAMFAAIFYFMIIRPQKKKQKAHDEMLASIYLIELDEGVKARILKSSISMKKGEGSTAPQQPKKKKGKKNEQQAQETKPEEELPAETEAQPAEAPAEEKPVEAEPQPAEEAPAEEKPRPQVGAGFEK